MRFANRTCHAMGRRGAGLFAAVVLACACSSPKDPTSSGSSASGTADAACKLGDSCSTEGASCSAAPIGSGWSHAFSCSGGKWTELEIAPLPQPPPTTTP